MCFPCRIYTAPDRAPANRIDYVPFCEALGRTPAAFRLHIISLRVCTSGISIRFT